MSYFQDGGHDVTSRKASSLPCFMSLACCMQLRHCIHQIPARVWLSCNLLMECWHLWSQCSEAVYWCISAAGTRERVTVLRWRYVEQETRWKSSVDVSVLSWSVVQTSSVRDVWPPTFLAPITADTSLKLNSVSNTFHLQSHRSLFRDQPKPLFQFRLKPKLPQPTCTDTETEHLILAENETKSWLVASQWI